MGAWIRFVAAMGLPMLLASCLLAPGKFTSRLVISSDRSFSFSHQGEVYALDPESIMRSEGEQKAAPDAANLAELEAKYKAIAEALGKEAGYRSVRHLGGGKFMVDYQVAGTLTHHLVFPFNLDAEAVVPFVALELRANGTVRVKAPGFASEKKDQVGPMSGGTPGDKLDGTFVLETDAEIVSQNNEEGPVAAGLRKTISWKVTPLTRDAPSAVLRLK